MQKPTRRLAISSRTPDPQTIAQAARVIRAGGLVAFPTETVYGLGANALDAAAVQGIFAAKGRPSSDPLIVHLADLADLPALVTQQPPAVAVLARACWPGPLTLILPRSSAVPKLVTAGRDTVALRVPAHPVARALLRAAETPIAAPSANRFGHTSPTTAAHVLADLDRRIDMVLDGGPTPIGLESTVLDLTAPIPTVLRPGGVGVAELRALLGAVEVRSAMLTEDRQEGLRAPGMLERHYAPDAELWLCIGPAAAALDWMAAQIAQQRQSGRKVGILVCDEDIARLAALVGPPQVDSEPLGSEQDLEQIAHRLYAALRALDARQPALILARDFGEHGLALAIRDRLMRAASGRVVRLQER